MSYPDSSTIGPLFIEVEPDWSENVTVEGRCQTLITMSSSSGEQRSRKRYQPAFAMNYTVKGLSPIAFSQWRSKLTQYQRAPIVIPVWTDEMTLGSMPTVNSANLGSDLTLEKFKIASWAYMVQAGKVSTFRKITAIAGAVLTFAAIGTAVYPATGVNTFTAGALVYPCIVGMFPNGGRYKSKLVTRHDTVIDIEEI